LQGDHQSSLCHPAVMMRRQTVLDVGKYREQFQFCEDLDLWLRLAERGRLANLPIVLLKYRTHQSNKSNQRVAQAVRDFQTILTETRLRRGLPVGELPAGPQGEQTAPELTIHERWGWQALGGGHVATARKHARKSLIVAPFSMNAWKLFYCALRGH